MNGNHTNRNQSSLQLTRCGEIVFESNGNWLHPLFDLTDFLAANPIDTSEAHLQDKIIGKAAALLICRIGVATVHGGIMSSPAAAVFAARRVPYTYDTLVDRIDCRTEEILADVNDTEAAYDILIERAGRNA